MTTISSHAKNCLEIFRKTTDALNEDEHYDTHTDVGDELNWEKRRFTLWCANLGALKSAILSHLRRLLKLLQACQNSFVDMPIEGRVNAVSVDDGYYSDESSSESDSDDDTSTDGIAQSGLDVLAKTIRFIIEELFVLSFRIRTSSKQPYKDSRIKTLKEIDADSGIDKFEAYAEPDTARIEACLLQMRADVLRSKEGDNRCTLGPEDTFLVDRLVATMKMRRKTIRYRERHAPKLTSRDEEESDEQGAAREADGAQSPSIQQMWDKSSGKSFPYAESSKSGTTLFSPEATKFFDVRQEETDTQSFYPYDAVATEATEVLVSGISFPHAPPAAYTDNEFVCPFCSVVIPSQHGKGKAWNLHVLRDLQPYFCTYKLCRDGDVLYDSKLDWLEHERLSHRRAWRCPDHTSSVFEIESDFIEHIISDHTQSRTEQQIDSWSRLAKCTLKDARSQCPFCLTLEFDASKLEDHMAAHMQQFALVSITVASDADKRKSDQVSMRYHIPLEEVSREGFTQHTESLNPQGSPQLLEKIVDEQLKRHQRLSKLRRDHEQAAQEHKCPNGDLCRFEDRLAHRRLTPRYNASGEGLCYVIAHAHTSILPALAYSSWAETLAIFPEGIPVPLVPQLPARFECPLCFRVKDFQKPSDWTKHVHEDLQPFTCTFPDCEEPRSFKRKADWVRHENEAHRHLEQWKCTACSHVSYRKDNFIQHLNREHKIPEPKVRTGRLASRASPSHSKDTLNMTLDQVWQMVNNCRSDSEKEAGQEPCRFCGETFPNFKKLTVHLSQHLLQLSLPILDAIGQKTRNENSSIEINWDLKPDNILIQEGPQTGKSQWTLTDLRPAQHELEVNDVSSIESDAHSQIDGREEARSGLPRADVADRGAHYYYCPHDECRYKSTRKGDVQRHLDNTHNFMPKFDCLVPGCPRTGANGFKQKYHRNEHMMKSHNYSEVPPSQNIKEEENKVADKTDAAGPSWDGDVGPPYVYSYS